MPLPKAPAALVVPVTDTDHIQSPLDAPVTLIEYDAMLAALESAAATPSQ